MKKLSKVEKIILAITDKDKYDIYRCPEHGVYAILKGNEDTCRHGCDKGGTKYEE